jgi:hypothetical protein
VLVLETLLKLSVDPNLSVDLDRIRGLSGWILACGGPPPCVFVVVEEGEEGRVEAKSNAVDPDPNVYVDWGRGRRGL